ncbi:MAG TPA: glycosyltransferase family 1 protein [Acidimicrobiia bacterium]
MAAGLLGALSRRADVRPVAYAVSLAGRDRLRSAVPPGTAVATRPLPARVARAAWQRGWPEPRIERWTGDVDVVHAVNYVAPPARAPVIVSVHDLTVLRFPELCTTDTLHYPALLRRAITRGAYVHTDSEFVATEVREELGVPAERVTTIAPGLPEVAGGDAARGREVAGGVPYALALGTVEPRKNLPILVDAFAAVAAAVPDARLVVAGPDGWGRDAFQRAVDNSPVKDRIVRLGYVSEETRADLLAGASVFAYPSVYEGFGFPPLEAMAAGVPVVASTAGSLPEVLGDAALLVDPRNADELAAAIKQLLCDSETRARYAKAGLQNVMRFSWTDAADRFVDLYRRVA